MPSAARTSRARKACARAAAGTLSPCAGARSRWILAALWAAGCGGGSDGHPSVSAKAATPYADSPVTVEIRGLQPDQQATLRARWTALSGRAWASSVPVRADGDGAVALRGFDGMRFLWGMTPVAPQRGRESFFPAARGANRVALSLVAGREDRRPRAAGAPDHGAVGHRAQADAAPRRRRRLPVHARGPDAAAGGGRVRRLGGRQHDDRLRRLLASHGYPALALAYFKAPGLPRHLVNVPLEYFERAIRIVRRQPAADPARVVTVGARAAARPRCCSPRRSRGSCTARSGSCRARTSTPASAGDAAAAAWTFRGRPIHERAIAVERIDGRSSPPGRARPDLELDRRSPRRSSSGSPTTASASRTARCDYEAAGHLVGGAVPYLPHNTHQERFGGTLRGDAAARADLWPRILRFFADL